MNDLELRFQKLAKQWKRDTSFSSSITHKVEHSAHREIVAMGKAALPLILLELKKRPDHWFWALWEITGEDAAQKGDNFDQARRAWLLWGKKKGYLK